MKALTNKYGFTFDIEHISPELAEGILETCNHNNRTLRPNNVNAIAQAIQSGEWVVTHQGIAFSKSGRLLDGQHRLAAIVKAGIGVEMVVVRGLSDEAAVFFGIDIGVRRSTADQLREDRRATEVARLLSRITYGSNTSASQVLEVLNCGVREVHESLVNACPSNVKFYSATPIRAAAVVLMMMGRNASYVKKTYTDLCHLNYQELNSAPLAMVRQHGSGKAESGRVGETFFRAMKCLDPSNRNLTKIQVKDGDIERLNAVVRNLIKSSTVSLGVAA